MDRLTRFQIARSPDVARAADVATRGWNLLTSAQSGQALTSSPAGLLLTPAQVTGIAPLSSWQAPPAASRPGLFDSLHAQLHGAFEANDYAAVARHASAFLAKHPPIAPSRRSGAEQAIHRFFRLTGRSSTESERLALYDSLTPDERADWFRAAPARIDLEKSQALAAAAAGVSLGSEADLLGGLHADLAFSVLAAGLAANPDRGRFSDKYVDRVLRLDAFLPPFVFALDPCGTPASGRPGAAGPLERRLARLAAYRDSLEAIAAVAQERGHGPTDGDDPCDCRCDDPPCLPIDPCCANIGWYVSELLSLRVETRCYKPSDLAYIENVAPWETRIRSHGFSRVLVETSEDERTSSRTEERDHQVTDRFSLQKEIENSQSAALEVDAKLKGKIFGQAYELRTGTSLTKESAYREAREQARETIERAALTLQVQSRRLRSRTVTTQTDERNKHKIKNGTGIAAVAKYFWVTQEKRAQLLSHGPAVTIDLLIPSPSLLFQHMQEVKRERGFTLAKPEPPAKPMVDGKPLAPKHIVRDNYAALAEQYGVTEYDDPPAPPPTLHESATVSRGTPSQDITIPPGYTATEMTMHSVTLHRQFLGFARISADFGGGRVSHVTKGSDTSWTALNTRSSGAVTISEVNASKDSSITVVIRLEPDPVDLGPWQKSLYASIMAKYEEALAKYESDLKDYNEALEAYNAKFDEAIKGRHPFACEEIMRTELKRLAIFLMCGEFDWPDVMNMKAQPCGMPWPNRKEAERATSHWYFFDRAFNWNLATFTFFDYFRNPMCRWVDTYEPDEPNFLFKAFLRAGYARAEIPVFPGMEEDVKTYLQTGAMWGPSGTMPSDPADPRWISAIEEIKHSHGCFQQDREGHAEAYPDPVTGAFDSHVLVYTDRYWDPLLGAGGGIDGNAIALDLDHEIYIDGIAYRIVSIVPDPAGPPFSTAPGSAMQWIVGLDRRFESAPFIDPAAAPPLLKPYNYAVGARFVGAPFHFDLPTDLIWIGDQDNPCLPCYPIECKGAHPDAESCECTIGDPPARAGGE